MNEEDIQFIEIGKKIIEEYMTKNKIKKWFPISTILSDKDNLLFEDDWEEFIRQPSENVGGVREFISSLFGKSFQVEIGDYQYQYWEYQAANVKIFIVFKFKGPVSMDCFVAFDKKVNTNTAMESWNDLIEYIHNCIHLS